MEQRAGQTAEATEHYRKAVELDPSDARSLAALGTILEGQGDALLSLDYYERARRLDPSRSSGTRHRAGAGAGGPGETAGRVSRHSLVSSDHAR